MDDGDRKRKALLDAERQRGGQPVEIIREIAGLCEVGNPLFGKRRWQMKETSVQLQILAHRQFAIERECLRHVTDTAA